MDHNLSIRCGAMNTNSISCIYRFNMSVMCRVLISIFVILQLGYPSSGFNNFSVRRTRKAVVVPPSNASRTNFLSNLHTRKSHILQTEAQLSTTPDKSNFIEQIEKTDPLDASRGTLLALFVIFGLAINAFEANEMTSVSTDGTVIDTVAKVAVSNIADAALPSSSTDLVAAAVGESLGGIIGALTTFVVTMLVKPDTNSQGSGKSSPEPMITQAISDSDYFIANSASLPLLEALGLPPGIASIGSVIFAAIPSQLVKVGAQRKQLLLEEERAMQRLLKEKVEATRGKSFLNRFFTKRGSTASVVDPKDLVPMEQYNIDPVEIFCDVTRWLEYSALQSNLGDNIITWNGQSMEMDGALAGVVFGIIAAVSAQLYADFLYGAFQFGPKQKRDELSSRNASDWVTLYSSKALFSATLFGFYELSQGPISRLIQGTLAGGVDGCIGSESFDICLQTYIDTNSPGPTPEAQLRALVTNLVMVGQRLQDVAVDTSIDDVKALVGAWSVSFLSWLSSITFLQT